MIIPAVPGAVAFKQINRYSPQIFKFGSLVGAIWEETAPMTQAPLVVCVSSTREIKCISIDPLPLVVLFMPDMPDQSLDQLEVTVRFQVGSAKTTLGELKTIQPGFIFETHNPVSQPVTIEINGMVCGRGELVQIGENVGVRVQEYTGCGEST